MVPFGALFGVSSVSFFMMSSVFFDDGFLGFFVDAEGIEDDSGSVKFLSAARIDR